tara:strand:+ start:5752 stop:6108 length:357 start_codon:yes stop_codon:yes gene_type:complete
MKDLSPERQELIAMSQQAKAIQKNIELTTGQKPTINSILLDMHAEAANTTVFKLFNEWRNDGYKVKKNSKAFRIWASPRKAKKGSDDTGDKDSAANPDSSYQFYPMCCLFSEHQVEKV